MVDTHTQWQQIPFKAGLNPLDSSLNLQPSAKGMQAGADKD